MRKQRCFSKNNVKRVQLSKTDDIAALIAQVALRDRDAFDVIYSQTSAKLFGVLLRLLGDRAEAEDALQEVFVRVWQKADRLATQEASAMSWLIAIARNHAIDRLRTRKSPTSASKTTELDDVADVVADAGPSPEQSAINAGEARRIDLCMGQLDAEKAEAVRAAYIEGYSYQELADRYNTPINTMRTWLRRSLMSLRQCLEAS